MKEEITRINRLVADGRLSPEDAADLIDAFYSGDRAYQENAENTVQGAPSEPKAETINEPVEAGAAGETPPTPPGSGKDPLKSLIESIEKLTKEGMEAVNWNEVAHQAKTNARKGFDVLKTGIEDISKGKVHLGWLTNQEVKEVTLPLSLSGKILKIENPCGDVKIVGGFDIGSVAAKVKVKAASHEEAKAKADEYTLIIEESDHAVSIRQPDISGLSVDLEIQMAGNGSIEVRSEAGNVHVLDTKGGARIHSKSGDIHLRGLIGVVEVSDDSGNVVLEDIVGPTISVENKSGNLECHRVKGNLTARGASGNITVTEGGGRVISLEAVSGNVHLSLDEPIDGTVNVRTVSGNSNIAIPDTSDCRVSLSTLRGLIHSGISLQDEAKSESRLTGRLNDGTGALDVSAVTGNISLDLRSATVSA